MSVPFILLLSGLVVVAWLFGWYLFSKKQDAPIDLNQFNLPHVSNGDALLISQEHGRLVYANEPARRWLNMNGGIPNLEQIAQMTEPSDNFLQLFATEGQSSFQLNERWVEASSHRIPDGEASRTVVVIRELSQSTSNPDVLDMNKAMSLINEMGETVNAGMGVEQVLQTLLIILSKYISMDAGELCLWDENEQALYQRGWFGDTMYLIMLTEMGGKYALDEGISGWVARHQKPLMVNDPNTLATIQPKLLETPYQSFIAIPLKMGAQFIGTLEVASEKIGHYTQADVALLQAISKPVATMIYNTEIYDQQVRRVDDLARLQDVVKTASNSTTSVIYEALNQRIAELVSANMSGIFLYDDDRVALVPQMPFYNLPEALIRNILIPLPEDSPQRDIWERQPYWVSNDVIGEELVEVLGLRPIVEVAGINNTAWIPLQIGEQRIGVLAVSNKQSEGGFNSRDIQNLVVLASQAAIVIENLRLYERERRLDTELVGLQEITNAIGALSHETEFFGEITERIARLMGISMCGILLYDEATKSLVSQLPFYGLPDEAVANYRIELPLGSVMQQLWEEDAYWYSNRVAADTLVYEAGLNDLADHLGIQKTLIATLKASGRQLGVVQISNKLNGQDFDESDVRLLLIFATQAAAIIENARLFREAQRSAEQAQGLRRVAELAGNVLTSEDSLLPVLSNIAMLMSSEMVYINVLNQQTGSLITYPRWVYGMEMTEPIVQDIYTPGFEHSVTASGRPFLSNDVMVDKRVLPGYRQIASRMGLRNTILVPLVFGERVLGELGVANRLNNQYTQTDLEVMLVIASQISAALDRLLLYEETGLNLNRRENELEAISRVSNELTLTLELDQILNVIRQEAIKATSADEGTVVLLQPPDRWRYPNQPQMERRLGNASLMPKLADIELEAISRGVDNVLVDDYEFTSLRANPENARSAVAAAIIYLDQVVGVLHIYKETPNHFDDRAAAFLMTMASKAALGYGNAARYREQLERSAGLRRRVEQLSRIFELGHMFQGNNDPASILEAIAYSVQHSVGFDTIVMTLLDEEAGVLRRVAHAGLPLEAFQQSRVNTISKSRLDHLLQEKYRISESYLFPVEDLGNWYIEEVAALSTAYEGNRTIMGTGGNDWRDGDMLLVTMAGASGKLIGVMSLDRPHNNQRPDRGEIEILEIFAHQAAITIENTRLFMGSVRSAEQEARLNEVFEAVSSTLDIVEIVKSLARGALRMLPFTRMTVALADVEEGFDLIRLVVNPDNTLDVKPERQRQLGYTALDRTYAEGLDYIYRVGEPAVQQYDDLKRLYAEGEKISLILPMLTGGGCLGAIHIGSDLANAYGFVEFRQLLKRMAQLVASSIQNARLFNQAVDLQVLNRSVVESIQQGIIVLDTSGHIISSNEFMQRRYGWKSSQEIKGEDLFMYQPDMADFLANDLRQVLDDGEPKERIHQTTITNDGSTLTSNFYIYPLRSTETVSGAVILVEDVTERYRLEQEMEARANQLAALTDVSSRITSSLERDEVVQLALDEMDWLIEHNAMTLWRRNGSYMVLEGSNGEVDDSFMEHPAYRFLFAEYDLTHQVVDSQRVVTVGRSSQVTENLPLHQNAQSWMGVPLVNQGHVVGMVLLTSEKPYAYETKSDQNIAFAFASQVAIALANADLFEQTFDRTNELGTLLEAATATALTNDLNDVFRTVVELMFNTLDMDDCAIMIWDEVDNQLEVQLDMNRHGAENRITPKGTLLDLAKHPAKLAALREREVIVITQDDVDSPYPEELSELMSNGDTARLLVPLVVGDETIGVIQLEQASDDNMITQQKVRLARALGSQVAVAIQNARLSEQTRNQFEESLIINDLSRAISSTLNIDDMMETVAEQLPNVADANELYLALYEPDTQEITFPIAVHRGEKYKMPPRKLGNDEVSFVIKHRRPLNLGADYFTPDDLRKSLGIINGEGDVKSYMGVPLLAGDEVVGVLAVRDTERTRAFTLNIQRVLTIIGSQLGAAIQNARLFRRIQGFVDELNEQVKERTFELEEERDRIDTLYQITSELARTLDMERLMPRALGMVAKAVTAQDGVIMQLDPITDQLYSRAVLNPHSLQHGPDGELSYHPAESLARFLIEEDEHVIMVDDLHDEAYWDTSNPGAAQWRSALAVLLETNEELLGVMVLLSRDIHAFEESHLRLMVAAANQVASSINNAELYKLIRDQAERLGSLLRTEQEEAEKNKAIVEGIADGVILSDADGRIILFNSAAERILEIPRDQAMGQVLSQLTGIYGGSTAQWGRAFAVDDQEEFTNERLQLGDKTVSVHLSPVYTGEKFLGTVSVIRDITREVEADLSKSKFIEGVSHEFRTPLTPIKGYIDMVLMGATGQITDAQKSILGTVKNNVDRLALLVEDVLEISQLDQGKNKFKPEQIDLVEIVHHVLENITDRARHKNKDLTVIFEPPAHLPIVEADQDKVIRILTNLIDNAFNYTPSGGSIEIGLEPRQDSQSMMVYVRDTGVGIPADFYDKVWRRFERHEDTVLGLEVAGTGLGLPIVKELIEMHGGDIWFDSVVNQGTTFYFTLPFKQADYTMASSNGSS